MIISKKKSGTRVLTWVMSMVFLASTILGMGNSMPAYAADNNTVTGVTTHTYNGSTVGLFNIYSDGNTYTGFCSQHALSNPATGSSVTWTTCENPYVLSAVYFGYGGDGGSQITDSSGNLLSTDAQIVCTDLAVSYYRGLSESGLSYDNDDTPTGDYAGSKPADWNSDYGRYVKYCHDNVDKVPIGDTFQFRKGDASGEICTTFDAQTFDGYDGICTDWIYVDAPYYSSFDITVPANVTLHWKDTTDGTSSGTISGGSTDKLWGTYKFYMQCTDDAALESLGTWSSGTLTSSKRVTGWYAETGSTTQDLVCYTLHYPTASFNVAWPAPSTPVIGSLSMTKVSANPGLTDGNPCYSLAGAEYQVYTDTACTSPAAALVLDADGNQTGTTNALLVTNADGSANTLYMQPGIYYAKETKSSKGFKLDTGVYRIAITDTNAGTTQTFTSTEQPVGDPASIEVAKTDSEGITMVQNGSTGAVTTFGNASLEGAVFKVTYYNDYYDSASVGSATPTRTWYIQTKYDAATQTFKAKLDTEHLASGYTSDLFYHDTTTGVVMFPLGTVTYEEYKPAPGYNNVGDGSVMTDASGTLTGNKSIMQIRMDNPDNPTAAHPYVESASGGYETNAAGIPIKVFTTAAAGSSVAVSEEIKRGDFSFTKADLDNKPMEDVYFQITSSTGESHVVKTGTDGICSSAAAAHTQYTNAYDLLFDDDPDNDYINDTYIGDMDCGLWFYGTADEREWNPANIDDAKGAMRYDNNYIIKELPCPANKGMQLMSARTIAITAESVANQGVYTNVPAPSIHTLEWDADTGTHMSIAGDRNTIKDTISYNYLTAGKTYTAKGILMELDEAGTVTGPLLDADGNYIRANTVFTVEDTFVQSGQEKCGTVDVTYEFNGTGLDGKYFVIFEYLYEGSDITPVPVNEDGTIDETGVYEGEKDTPVKHTDVTDINQIGFFVQSKIRIYKTGDQVIAAKEYTSLYGTFNRLEFAQKPLQGTVFEIRRTEDDSLVDTVTTGPDGYAESKGLPWGDYYLLETKTRNGLVLDTEPIAVELVLPQDYHKPVYYAEASAENRVGNTEINVYKKGEILNISDGTYSFGTKPLPGVIFGVYADADILDYEGNVVIKKDDCIGFIKTGEDGKATLKDALVEGSYYYKEVKTLDGYILDETKREFNLLLGNTELNTIDVNKANPDINRLYKTKLQLVKSDSADSSIVLSGVEFELYNEKDELMGTYVTDQDGRIIIDNLPYGSYYFVETKAADGYMIDTSHQSFTATTEGMNLSVTNEKKPDTPTTGDTMKLKLLMLITGILFLFGIMLLLPVFRKEKMIQNILHDKKK